MSGFSRDMAREAMRQTVGRSRRQHAGRSTNDKTIQQHRHIETSRCQQSPNHGSDLASANAAQGFQRVAQRVAVMFQRHVDNGNFVLQGGACDTRTRSHPACRIAAKQGRCQRGCRRGVTNPHFTEDQQICACNYGCRAAIDRRQAFGLVHRRRLGKIRRRAIQIERHDRQAGSMQSRKLIDRSTAPFEICHHLRSNFCRIGRDAPRCYAMIASKDGDVDLFQLRHGAPLPASQELRAVFQSRQGTGRFGQLVITRTRGIDGSGISRRQGLQGRPDGGKIPICFSHAFVRPALLRVSIPACYKPRQTPSQCTMTEPESPSPQQPRSRQRWFGDLRLALMLLTRLPLPRGPQPAGTVARAAWIFPLVGMLVGLGGGIVFMIANRIGLGISSAAILALTWQVLITGALHEDGLADTADGFGGGRDREHKLAIMRDSRIGTYGVVALLLIFGLRFAALEELASNLLSVTDEMDDTVSHTSAIIIALAVAGAVSRAAMAFVWYLLPPARSDGLAAGSGSVPLASAIIGLAIACILTILLLPGFTFAVVLGSVALLTLAMALLAWRQIGGHTGDVLGATQQVTEVAALLAIGAMTMAV